MDYTIVGLVLLTVFIGTVSSFVVYLYMKTEQYLKEIHHRIDNEVNYINNENEHIRRNITDVSNEKINKIKKEIDLLYKRIDGVYQDQRNIENQLIKLNDSKNKNDNKKLLKD